MSRHFLLACLCCHVAIWFFVGEVAFVIGLSQISSVFSCDWIYTIMVSLYESNIKIPPDQTVCLDKKKSEYTRFGIDKLHCN